MGVFIKGSSSYFEFSAGKNLIEKKNQVFLLADKVLSQLFSEINSEKISHLLVATTCPDSLAPSLGQMIAEKHHDKFAKAQVIDMVQGCAGGVSAMILASQLAEWHQSNVIVIHADAAQKATSKSEKIHANFGNGAFACLFAHTSSSQKLMYSMSRQYKGLSEVINLKLGHDADQIISQNPKVMTVDPRKLLGLTMNNKLAIQLFKHAEDFYKEFISLSVSPDVMILHQVNPLILSHLKIVFAKYPVQFIDLSAKMGNCGAASVGIAFDQVKDTLKGKKVFLCSFGTGGVITAGLWQN